VSFSSSLSSLVKRGRPHPLPLLQGLPTSLWDRRFFFSVFPLPSQTAYHDAGANFPFFFVKRGLKKPEGPLFLFSSPRRIRSFFFFLGSWAISFSSLCSFQILDISLLFLLIYHIGNRAKPFPLSPSLIKRSSFPPSFSSPENSALLLPYKRTSTMRPYDSLVQASPPLSFSPPIGVRAFLFSSWCLGDVGCFPPFRPARYGISASPPLPPETSWSRASPFFFREDIAEAFLAPSIATLSRMETCGADGPTAPTPAAAACSFPFRGTIRLLFFLRGIRPVFLFPSQQACRAPLSEYGVQQSGPLVDYRGTVLLLSSSPPAVPLSLAESPVTSDDDVLPPPLGPHLPHSPPSSEGLRASTPPPFFCVKEGARPFFFFQNLRARRVSLGMADRIFFFSSLAGDGSSPFFSEPDRVP